MAKEADQLPTLERAAKKQPPTAAVSQEVKPRVQFKIERATECTLAIPFASVNGEDSGFQYSTSRRADPGNLTKEQLRKLRAIYKGCILNDERLASGEPVKTLAHVFRLMLDKLDI